MDSHLALPTYTELMPLALNTLKRMSGTAPFRQLISEMIIDGGFSEEQQQEKPPKSGESKLESRSWWALWYLAKEGLLERPKRGVYSLTSPDASLSLDEAAEIVKRVNASYSKKVDTDEEKPPEIELSPDTGKQSNLDTQDNRWKERLLEVLRTSHPSVFERLCQLLLIESGFTQVKVTGKSGDGGIDGRGVLRLGDLISFQVLFQCKRYRGVVGAPEIRNFRGAMWGKSDKGLFITTGSFTANAVAEAVHDGAPPIDLIDGDQLCELLKQRGIGVRTKQVEVVEIDTEFFSGI
jgi:restriction system protein